MTPQLLIACAELLGLDVPTTFRRALGHGVGFRSEAEVERFAQHLNAATEARPSRWRNQRGADRAPQTGKAGGTPARLPRLTDDGSGVRFPVNGDAAHAASISGSKGTAGTAVRGASEYAPGAHSTRGHAPQKDVR